MAIAHDASSTATNGTGNLSWTHTPSGTPKGAVVQVIQYATAGTADQVSGVTYGGVAMTEVSGSPVVHTGAVDFGVIYTYFLGSSVPTGAQTVTVTVTGADSKHAIAATVTASADTEVEGVGTLDSGASADPSPSDIAVTTGVGVETMGYGALLSGAAATTAVASTDTELLEFDFGASIGAWSCLAANDAGGGFTMSWTTGGQEAAGIAVAIKQAAGGAPPAQRARMTVVDADFSEVPVFIRSGA